MQRRPKRAADAPVYTTGGRLTQLTIAAEKGGEIGTQPARVDLRSPDSAFSAALAISEA